MTLSGRLKSFLAACDEAAVENVRAGKGGPFAASLHVHDPAHDGWVMVAGPVGNAVLETGIASAHAEDRVIAPENIARLKAVLAEKGPGAQIYAVSSAESCPACHAKLEILARDLIRGGHIAPGAFTVVYGASYEDTEAIAGFNDAPYHHDFQKPPGTGLIRQETRAAKDLPENVSAEFETGRVCAVVALDGVLYKGAGTRPEVAAIQAACRARKESGIADSWDLKGATLYTWTRDIGPLAYAEAQWANIGRWVTVMHEKAGKFQTVESEGIANGDLFRIVASRPYTHPDSALRFLHLTPFENRAQREWRLLRENGNVRVYNGAG